MESAAAVVADFAKKAAEQVAYTQTRLKDQQQIQRFWDALSEPMKAGRPSEALRVLTASKKQLELLSRADPDGAAWIESLRPRLRAAAEDTLDGLPQSFPAAVQYAGLALDPKSRHPKYTLLNELIEVRFDRTKLETTVLPRDGRKTVLGIEPAAVAEHLAQEVARLTGRPFDPFAFLESLAIAYRAVSESTGAGAGANVPIKDLIAELAKDRDFHADEFNVDLSKLVRDKESAGKVFLDNARDARNGILLWELDQRGYYGYIRVEG